MRTVGIIQARMGSSRLPGKMMLPLAGEHTITRVVERAAAAERLDEVVVATSQTRADNILERYAERAGAAVVRGSEDDVLGRVFEAATEHDADVVVRLTGDCPLLPPDVIDAVVEALETTDDKYAASVLERTFPRGFGAEAFTYDSFVDVQQSATAAYEREHVTPYYRENDGQFTRVSVTSEAVFDAEFLQDRTDLRLTLDEADDYELLKKVYSGVAFDDILPIREAIRYIDDQDLQAVNAHVTQRTLEEVSES